MAIEYSEPFKAFRFLVEVEDGGVVVAAFSQFSGVRMRVQTVPVRTGSDIRGVMDSVPALTQYENVKLTKGVIGDNDFIDWLSSVSPSALAGPKGGSAKTINIVALDNKGNRGVVWTLHNAIPVAYEMAPMDASSSQVLSETIEFEIMGFTRKTIAPPTA